MLSIHQTAASSTHSGVASPKLDINVRDGSAGVDVVDIDVEVKFHALFVLTDIWPDELALYPYFQVSADGFRVKPLKIEPTVRPLGDFRVQDALSSLPGL